MKKQTENWLKIAKYDLKSADLNYRGGQYLTAVEKCHNALEKLLKGIITENNDTPSRIHNLLKLAAEALIDNLKEEIKILFTELNHYYSNTRYPDDFVEMEEEISEPTTKKILDDTKGVFKWLEKKLN